MKPYSSRQRVLDALNHKETDRCPIAMVCGEINPPALKEFDAYLTKNRGISADEYIQSFLDVSVVGLDFEGGDHTDMWGVSRRDVSYGEGCYSEIYYSPLKDFTTLEQLKRYPFPKAKDMPAKNRAEEIFQIRKNKNTAIVLGNANLFETSWYMRGFEQALMDIMLMPDMIHYIMETVTSFFIDYFYEVLKLSKGDVDMVFTADDIGQQEGLLVSLESWEEFIKPYHVRINEMIHNMGAKVIYHTDGAVMDAVPGLMDMGIDVLQALQFSAKGMDPQILKDNYGDRLCFEGGMCVQKILPFGTVEEVKAETRRLISILGKSGGYLCGPSHFIQAGTPPENIVAFFDEAVNYRFG